MKKLLLTLGSAASVVAPLATVVACGSEDSLFSGIGILEGTNLTITGMEFTNPDELTEDTDVDKFFGFLTGFAALLKNEKYDDVTNIVTTVSAFQIENYVDEDGPLAPATLGDITSFAWETGTIAGEYEATEDQMMAYSVFLHFQATLSGNIDATAVKDAITGITGITSTATGAESAGLADTHNVTDAISTYKLSGITEAELEAVLMAGDAVDGDWVFEKFSSMDATWGVTVYFYHKDTSGVQESAELNVEWATA